MKWTARCFLDRKSTILCLGGVVLLVATGLAGEASGQTIAAGAAQIPSTRAMTLAEALSYARVHHPRMRASDAHIAEVRAEAWIPRAQWLPTVGATAQVFGATANNSTTSYIGSSNVDLPRIGSTRVTRDVTTASWVPAVSTLAALGVNQEVFDFGRIAAQSAAADAAIEVETHRGAAVWLALELGVREAYYAVLAARGVVDAADDAYHRATAHRDLAQAWVTQGLRSRIELERAEADLARFEVGRIRARGGLVASRAGFAGAVGLADAQLEAVPEATNPAPLPSLADAIRQAGVRDPLVLAMLARVQQQSARTRAIAAEALPDVSLTAAISGRAGGAVPSSGDPVALNGFVPVVPNWDVGLVFSWPIFDATVWARHTASQRAEDALRADVAAMRQAQFADVQRAWSAVLVAQETLGALERSVTAAQANYAQADARFRAGLGTSVELADAEALRTDAEIQLALGRFEVARARAQLRRVAAEGL